MSTTRMIARRLRTWPTLNRAATSAIRALRNPPPDAAVLHLPRQGQVEIELPDGGERVRFLSGDDWISSRLWWLGIDGYEPEVLRPFLRLARSARTVLDVGAYVGHFCLMAAAANPGARVFAFEPMPTIRARLGDNLARNPGLEVTVIPCAVGARRGPAQLHLGGPGMPPSSSLLPEWEGLHASIDVSTIDLDSFAEDWGVTETVDLIKIDTELSEPDVIAGMPRLLAASRPTIFTEVLSGSGANERYASMSDTLRASGYRFFHLTDSGPVPEDSLTPPEDYVDHLSTPVNHLACPADKVPGWL